VPADRLRAMANRKRLVQARAGFLGLVTAPAALRFAALSPGLFLRANKAQPTAMLADNARPFDGLGETSQELLKAF